MSDRNKKLASIFHDLASMYRFVGGENPFRANAYEKASHSIAELPEDVSFYLKANSIEDIPGVGESIKDNITEYLKTGHILRYEKLKKKVPFGLIELLEIRGFGPQSLRTLHQKLHVRNRKEVMSALESGRVSKLKGFGAKKVENMLRALKLYKGFEHRMLLWDARDESQKLIDWLSELPEVLQVEVAGSIRRRKETVGDIDMVAIVKPKDRKKVIAHFTNKKLCKRILAVGQTLVSIITKENEVQADLRMISREEWGSALLYFTGSREHTVHLRTLAKEQGLKINEYGIFRSTTGKHIAGSSEKEIYQTLKMQFIPPEMREDRGEIELALKNKIPSLVELKDVRGDLQMHSNWSDGSNTLEEIVEFVQKNFQYEYIAMTDHSKSSRIAGGMNERGFERQLIAIRKINERLGKDFLKAGAEVDILADGSLDLSDELLSQLDWVTASIHSGFSHDNTDRLVRACENKYVHCIGHPTGRIIGKRESYKIDVNALMLAAAETHTALEINSQPNRMDMNDEMAAEARKQNVMLVISTDSHRLQEYSFMKLGVDIARRAWCEKKNILNTHSWMEIQNHFLKKRK